MDITTSLLKWMIVLQVLAGNLTPAFACFSPKDGWGMDYNELVDSAEVIVLVQAERMDPDGDWSISNLRSVEALKGKAAPTYRVDSLVRDPSDDTPDNDFDRHRALGFWFTNTGRSRFPCCLCGPDHAFRLGATYLLFPDKLGAMKSAEVIVDPSDKWLAYVRAKAGAAAAPFPPLHR